MELVRLVAPLAKCADVARLAREHQLVFRCSDADTVIATASLSEQLTTSLGVWLYVSDGYPAQLAARDVATLAAIVQLDHVVVEADVAAPDHAQILASLLTNNEVSFTNGVATLSGAYNRPAPPSPITVWALTGESLVSGDLVLRSRRVASNDVGELTYFD
jgi:hypothetical protein